MPASDPYTNSKLTDRPTGWVCGYSFCCFKKPNVEFRFSFDLDEPNQTEPNWTKPINLHNFSKVFGSSLHLIDLLTKSSNQILELDCCFIQISRRRIFYSSFSLSISIFSPESQARHKRSQRRRYVIIYLESFLFFFTFVSLICAFQCINGGGECPHLRLGVCRS